MARHVATFKASGVSENTNMFFSSLLYTHKTQTNFPNWPSQTDFFLPTEQDIMPNYHAMNFKLVGSSLKMLTFLYFYNSNNFKIRQGDS